MWTRRRLAMTLGSGLASVMTAEAGAKAVKPGPQNPPQHAPQKPPDWSRTPEGSRQADLGNGHYLNPILAGDHPDPTVLKDGSDYYMTFSSFQAYPGAVIWHSRDLLNWTPIVAALTCPIGTVWAMDLIKHEGRFFIYIPVLQDKGTALYVIWADHIQGPWSEPVDLRIPGCIDPGHVVGEDGRRYLFVNGGRRVRLTADGLAADGPLESNAWQPWQYPADWEVEMFAPEGPKLLRRNGWFYLISAVGGTAGPATSHMVTVSRSRSVHGPWGHCPHNPVVRTRDISEPWWSRGHASVVEGPKGDWWMVYHGYENGFRTLGRQALLEPVEWTADGWLRARGGRLDRPLPAPGGKGNAVNPPGLSDDFSRSRHGLQWAFHAPAADESSRLRHADGGLVIRGKGVSPIDCSPYCCIAGDRSYEITVDLELRGDVVGGLLLFYDERGHTGLGFTRGEMRTFGYGQEHTWMREAMTVSRVRIHLRNRDNVLRWRYSLDGGATWRDHGWQMEVSGLHHNVFGGFLSLRPAIFSAGNGELVARDFQYRGLR
ncbi:family 43 glycosylhydrolase [Ideonella margarita]|uniref:Family 43 glycosylhydrolase n=1 Tax=Ideonella margarita TaxID=2984191 RepID=A0ABU9C720_9BURK